ncbi:hypothetical protein [Roseomonas sp. WA12]
MGLRPQSLLAWAGLVIGPAAWAANTQLGQMLPYPGCGAGFRFSLPLSAVAVLLSVLGSGLSWRVSSFRRRDASMLGFLGSLGALTGLLVAFALLLQALASVLVSPCAR